MLPGGRDVHSCRAQAATVWTISRRGDDAPPSPDPFPPNASTASIDPTNLPRLAHAEPNSVPRQKLAFRSCIRVHKFGWASGAPRPTDALYVAFFDYSPLFFEFRFVSVKANGKVFP